MHRFLMRPFIRSPLKQRNTDRPRIFDALSQLLRIAIRNRSKLLIVHPVKFCIRIVNFSKQKATFLIPTVNGLVYAQGACLSTEMAWFAVDFNTVPVKSYLGAPAGAPHLPTCSNEPSIASFRLLCSNDSTADDSVVLKQSSFVIFEIHIPQTDNSSTKQENSTEYWNQITIFIFCDHRVNDHFSVSWSCILGTCKDKN